MILQRIVFALLVFGILKNLSNKLELFFINQQVQDDYLMHQTKGQIGKENFTYYSLYEEGRIKILLQSSDGDADLYVASTKKPQLHPDLYDYSSITCGNDVVDLPSDMKRPIIVGVYGHPSFEHSAYTLSMYVNLNEPLLDEQDATKTMRGFNIREKLNFLMRYTTMWRIFEIVEGIFFML